MPTSTTEPVLPENDLLDLEEQIRTFYNEADESEARRREDLESDVDWRMAVSYTHLTLPTKRIV